MGRSYYFPGEPSRNIFFLSRISLLVLLCLVGAFTQECAAQRIPPDFINIEYARLDTFSLKLDIYIPKGVNQPFPVIVWIHGGGWRSGSKDTIFASFMLAHGFAIVSINYRLSQQAIFPAQIHDCKAALRWIRARGTQYGLDTSRIGVWGNSAGGHLVALLGTSGGVDSLEGAVGAYSGYSSRVRAVCDWYGPTNFLTMGSVPGFSMHNLATSAEGLLLGGAIPSIPEKARAASPITYVSPDDPPFLIMHGTADPTVPYQQSMELDSALRRSRVDVTLQLLPGAKHGGEEFHTTEMRSLIINFFDRTLKGTSATTTSERFPIKEYQLHQNYPNPFNPMTVISYQSPAFNRVSLKVYDALGREVAILVDEYKQPGNYSIRFVPGSSLPSGVYLYQLKAGFFVDTKKMLVIQ